MTPSKKRLDQIQWFKSKWKLNKKLLLNCDYCKKGFARPRSRMKRDNLIHAYCSMECYQTARKLPKPEQEQV